MEPARRTRSSAVWGYVASPRRRGDARGRGGGQRREASWKSFLPVPAQAVPGRRTGMTTTAAGLALPSCDSAERRAAYWRRRHAARAWKGRRSARRRRRRCPRAAPGAGSVGAARRVLEVTGSSWSTTRSTPASCSASFVRAGATVSEAAQPSGARGSPRASSMPCSDTRRRARTVTLAMGIARWGPTSPRAAYRRWRSPPCRAWRTAARAIAAGFQMHPLLHRQRARTAVAHSLAARASVVAGQCRRPCARAAYMPSTGRRCLSSAEDEDDGKILNILVEDEHGDA